jgi:hypothetical protein
MGSMTRGSPSFVAFLLLGCVSAGCKDDKAPPFAPLGGISTTRNLPQRDGGQEPDGGDEDAGPIDAGVPASACLRVPVLSTSFEDSPGETSTERPADFVVSRQAELWSSDCSHPQLTISLSDGFCPAGLGHELNLTFSVNDIEDGAIHLGNNAIVSDSESSSIRVRYSRPIRLKPHGVWGTCTGASGQIVFFEPPGLTAGSLFQARYQLTLPPCDDSSEEPMFVVGTFKLRLSYSVASICSTRTE